MGNYLTKQNMFQELIYTLHPGECYLMYTFIYLYIYVDIGYLILHGHLVW